MEVSRKLILVGFLVLVNPGSLLQLLLGMLVSLIFLLAQMQAQPYRERSDEILALITSASLVMLFLSCILLRATELTEFERVNRLLTDRTVDMYAIPSGLVILTLSGSTLLALVISVPLLLVSLAAGRREVVLRWTKDGWRVVPYHLPAGQFHT